MAHTLKVRGVRVCSKALLAVGSCQQAGCRVTLPPLPYPWAVPTHPPPAQGVATEGLRFRLVDAQGQVVGRLASQIARMLMGKDKPTYTPNRDEGDVVVVVNAAEVEFTGRKWDQKLYRWHTGYPGGLKERTAKDQFQRRPAAILEEAVSGMLPKNNLRRVSRAGFTCQYLMLRAWRPRCSNVGSGKRGLGSPERGSVEAPGGRLPGPGLLPGVSSSLLWLVSLFCCGWLTCTHGGPAQSMMRKLRIFPAGEHPFADEPNLVPFEMPPRNLRHKGQLFVLPEGWEPLNPEAYNKKFAHRLAKLSPKKLQQLQRETEEES